MRKKEYTAEPLTKDATDGPGIADGACVAGRSDAAGLQRASHAASAAATAGFAGVVSALGATSTAGAAGVADTACSTQGEGVQPSSWQGSFPHNATFATAEGGLGSRFFGRFRRRSAEQRHRDAALVPLRDILMAFAAAAGRPEQSRLVHLWEHWGMVMGEMLAPLALPLGARKSVLLVGAADSIVMQELTYMTEEILERANAFMGEPYFTEVKVSLPLGKSVLTSPFVPGISAEPTPLAWGEPLHGAFLAHMPPDSPVTRCYAAYVAAGRACQKT